MRTMLRMHIPAEAGNRAAADGSLPKAIQHFVDAFEPEAAYFFPDEGVRSAIFVFDLESPADIPVVAEHFFRSVGARVDLTPVMTVADLQAGLQKAFQRPT